MDMLIGVFQTVTMDQMRITRFGEVLNRLIKEGEAAGLKEIADWLKITIGQDEYNELIKTHLENSLSPTELETDALDVKINEKVPEFISIPEFDAQINLDQQIKREQHELKQGN